MKGLKIEPCSSNLVPLVCKMDKKKDSDGEEAEQLVYRDAVSEELMKGIKEEDEERGREEVAGSSRDNKDNIGEVEETTFVIRSGNR